MTNIPKDRADWLLDAIAGATQDMRFLRGDPQYDAVAGEAILLNAEKAIRVACERCAVIAEWAHMVPPDGGSPNDEEKAVADEAAKRIRAACGLTPPSDGATSAVKR